jgi:hypothetical protein
MAIVMGPVLKFVGTSGNNMTWRVSALVVVEASDPVPVVEFSADGVSGKAKGVVCGKLTRQTTAKGDTDALPKRFRGQDIKWTAYRMVIETKRGVAQSEVVYRVIAGGKPCAFACFNENTRQADIVLKEPFSYVVPGTSGQLSFAYASCNGFSSEKTRKSVDDHNAMWRFMIDRHQGVKSADESPHDIRADLKPPPKRSYHLLLLGGDQVYADNIYFELDWLQTLNSKRKSDFLAYKPKPQDLEDLEAFYFSLYVQRWSNPTEQRGHCAHLLARIPYMAMWDDHDIIDGWGSYEDAENMAPTSLAMFAAAQNAFCIFQQHLPLTSTAEALMNEGFLSVQLNQRNRPAGALSHGHHVDDVALIAIDTRSMRTRRRILDENGWQEFDDWVDKTEKSKPKHVLVMLGIPAMHADYSSIADAAGKVPNEMANELQDDMFDHWATREQKGERSRLIKKLFGLAQVTGCRVSLLSGDVHLAVAAVIRDRRNNDRYNGDEMYQLTSSGIVHPPPGWLELLAMESMFMPNTEKLSENIEGRRITLGDGGPKALRRRNWMSLEFESSKANPMLRDDTLWVNWFAEGETDSPYSMPLEYPSVVKNPA